MPICHHWEQPEADLSHCTHTTKPETNGKFIEMKNEFMAQDAPDTTFADFELLAEVSQLLNVIDLDGVLTKVIDLVKRAVDATKVSVFLHDQDSNDWQRLLLTRALNAEESRFVVQDVIDKGLAGWVLRNRRGTIVHDTQTDERWHVFPDDPNQTRSVLCLPLMQNDHVLAIITLIHDQPNHFTEHHLWLVTIIANQVAVAIRNAQLFNRLLEQQRQLEAVLHSIPDMLLVIDHDGQILLVNNEAEKALETADRSDLLGKHLSALFAIDRAFLPLQKLLEPVDDQPDTWMFETRSDRYRQDFLVTVSRWHSPFGGSGGHIIVLHDVTALRDLNRFKSEMLKLATHDLRSPLALIVGYCELIALDLENPSPAIQEYLETIRRSTRRMGGLLDDLLRVEEIRSSPSELQQQVNFGDLVDQVADSLSLLASAKGQAVTIKNEIGNLPPVTIDPMLVREAMENYTSNAVKYTPDGGRITMFAYADERHIYFEVEDTGIGIPPKDIEHVFEWGYRAKRSSATLVEGKGLGLSLVKSILERHRGEVWVESQEGIGSRFGFWLPR